MQKRVQGQKLRKKKEAAQPVFILRPALQKIHKKGNWYKENLSLLSNRERTEGEEVIDESGGGSEIEENEDSSVDIDDILDPEGAPAHRILCLEATQRPPVVTISERMVKVGYLEK